MGATLTTLDNLTKNVYLDGLPDFVNTQNPLAARIGRVTDKKSFTGRKFIFAAKTANNQGGGVISESETLPVAGNVTIINMELAMRRYYYTARLSAAVMKDTETNPGAFKSAVKVELDSVRDQLTEDMAMHMLFGDGYGAIGEVSSVSTNDITVKAQPTVGAIGARLIRTGQYLGSYTAKSGGSAGGGVSALTSVSAIASAVVTVGSGTSFAANDYLFRMVNASTDPRDKAMMGLAGIVDDGTNRGTFQNVSRTTYPSLKANKLGNSGVLRAWSQDLMDQLAQESQINGGGKAGTAYYSPYEIQRRAASYLRADRTYDMTTKKLDGGFSGVMWTSNAGTHPWFCDRFCVPNQVQFVHEPDLFLAIDEDVHFDEMDGSMWRYTDRKHELEAWLLTWRNLGARQCNNHSYLGDISHTA